MKQMTALIDAISNHANPVVVKELRQAVQSRVVIGILLLFLLVSVSTICGYITLDASSLTSTRAGQNLFQILYGLLVLTSMIFVPLYAAARFAMERNHSNMDLLFITTISPGKIIRGKFWAAAALTALIYSICMPFLCLTYLLRGIDLPSIFFSLGLAYFTSLVVIMGAIFAGSVAASILLRLFMAAALLYGGGMAIGLSLTGGMAIARLGISSIANDAGDWAMVALTLSGGAALLVLFYLLAVTAISAPSSNRMFPVRVYVTSCWLIYGLIAGVCSWIWSNDEPITIWMLGTTVVLCLALLFVLAEREDWSPRIRRTIPRAFFPRLGAWLLFTGSAGGVLWCCLLMIATQLARFLITHQVLLKSPPGDIDSAFLGTTCAFLYVFCYAMSGLYIRRTFFPQSQPTVSPIIGLILFAAASTLPLLIAYMVHENFRFFHELPWYYTIMNPFIASFDTIAWTILPIFLSGWSLVMLMLNTRWFREQWQGFVRYEPSEPREEAFEREVKTIDAVAVEEVTVQND